MAYTDQKMSGGKVTAIIIVALIHLALGYAFVTGLAYQYVKKAQEKLNTFDVAPPPGASLLVDELRDEAGVTTLVLSPSSIVGNTGEAA